MNRGLTIIALAALIGAALAAAVTLPALIVSGEEAPPAALSIAAGSKRVVVRAPALPRPRTVRPEPSTISPPASLALPPGPAQTSGSALASAPVHGSTPGTTGSVSREALRAKAQKRATPSKRLPPPSPTVAPPPPPPPPPPAVESTTKEHGHKQQGSNGKHEEHTESHGQGPKQKTHGNGHETGGAQKEHGHGHDNNGSKGKDKGDKGHGPKR